MVGHNCAMPRITVSLPQVLQTFLEEQVRAGGYGNSEEYICDLIAKERDRRELNALLLQGAGSARGSEANDAYFDRLRSRFADR